MGTTTVYDHKLCNHVISRLHYFSMTTAFTNYSNHLPSNLVSGQQLQRSWKNLHKKSCVLNLASASCNCSASVMTKPNFLTFITNVRVVVSDKSERNCSLIWSFPEGPNTHAHTLTWFYFCFSASTKGTNFARIHHKFTISSDFCGNFAHFKGEFDARALFS